MMSRVRTPSPAPHTPRCKVARCVEGHPKCKGRRARVSHVAAAAFLPLGGADNARCRAISRRGGGCDGSAGMSVSLRGWRSVRRRLPSWIRIPVGAGSINANGRRGGLSSYRWRSCTRSRLPSSPHSSLPRTVGTLRGGADQLEGGFSSFAASSSCSNFVATSSTLCSNSTRSMPSRSE